jgi:membrane protein DedA with SNARE-associated domain
MHDTVTSRATSAVPWIDRPSPGWRTAMLAVAGVLYASGTLGSNIAIAWMKDRPEVVIGLSARNRNLLGSVPFVNPLAYALIGFSRVVLVAIVLYLVGRWYGPKALGWVENQLGELPAVYRWAQTGLDRAGWLLVLLMPGSNLVCLLAGHRRMSVRRFGSMLLAGTVLKLIALWIGGRIFDHQIRAFFRFIDGYQWWLVAAAFLLTIVQGVRRAQKAPARLREVVADVSEPPSLDGSLGLGEDGGESEVSPTTGAT